MSPLCLNHSSFQFRIHPKSITWHMRLCPSPQPPSSSLPIHSTLLSLFPLIKHSSSTFQLCPHPSLSPLTGKVLLVLHVQFSYPFLLETSSLPFMDWLSLLCACAPEPSFLFPSIDIILSFMRYIYIYIFSQQLDSQVDRQVDTQIDRYLFIHL